MKKFLIIAAIFLCLSFVLTGCGMPQTPLEAFEEAWEKTDTSPYHEAEARKNGNTYCKNCKNTAQGVVNYCPYCGKRIK